MTIKDDSSEPKTTETEPSKSNSSAMPIAIGFLLIVVAFVLLGRFI